MDNKDQRRTHTHIQEYECHGVHACHKCGWPFPNPHPSSKQRRAHKKICGTIQGYNYKPLVSERQSHSNASDDNEHVSDDDPHAQGPNSLDTGINRKVNGGTAENLTRSGDEVFLDAIANFSDGGLSPGSKEPLRDSLDSATEVKIVDIKYQDILGSSDFNDVNQLIVKLTNDSQMQDPSILQREMVKDGHLLELRGQLSGSHVVPLSNSITDLRTVMHSDDFFGLSSDSNPSKGEAAPNMLPENKIYAAENVRHCSLASVEKETNLEKHDEIKSDSDMIDIVFFSDNTVGEAIEGMIKIAVTNVVNSECQMTSGAFNLEEKNNVELLSVIPQEEVSLEVNSILSTNTATDGVQVESAHKIQFVTSGDAKSLQEMREGNVNMFTTPLCDNKADVSHPQNECAEFKDHERVLRRNSLSLPSSEAWKPKQDELKGSDDEEQYFLINQSQLSEKREVLPPDGRVFDRIMKEQESRGLVAEEMHAEESIEVSSVKFVTESDKGSDETGASMNALKTEFSFMAASKENSNDTTIGGSTTETTSVISMKEITFTDVDGKCRGANVDTGIRKKTLQLRNMERSIVKDSSLPNPVDSNFECPILSEVVMDRPPQSPLGEAAHSNKPESPKLEENSMIHKSGESPAAKGVKGEGGKGWNSPARYAANKKRKNKKVKSKQNWIPFVCCSSVDSPRR